MGYFDNRSIIFTALLVIVVLTFFSWALALSRGETGWRRRWAIGNTLMTLGSSLYLTQGSWPPFFSFYLSNLLIILGFSFLHSGLRNFCGKPSLPWLPWAAVAVQSLLYVPFLWLWDSLAGRTLTNGTLSMVFLGLMIHLLQTALPEEKKRHRLLLAGFTLTLASAIGFFLVRDVMVFFEPARSVLDPSSSFAAIFLFVLVAMLGWTLSFIALDLLRKQRLLEQALATRDRLFTIIAHDLRGPVGNLSLLFHELSRNTCADDDLQAGLSMGANSARSSFELLENLLNWARLQKDEIVFKPGPQAVDKLVKAALEPLLPVAANKQINLSSAVSDGLSLNADFATMAVVLRNLLSNAIKFTPRGGQITVDGTQTPQGTVLTVTDTGSGFPPELLSRLQQGDFLSSRAGTEGEPGTGLGLLVCTEFVRNNRGSLDISSSSQGTVVKLTFPVQE